MQENFEGEAVMCRLFLRNRCNRGRSCPFYHPEFNFNPDSPTVSWLDFCRDFQRGQCAQQDCRHFHVTAEEEDVYRMRKDIAPSLLEQAMRKALLFDVALTGTKATCKRFLQGGCSMNMCPYRHITRHQFANEVLNTLRNEFEVVLGAFGTDIPGSQQMQNRNNPQMMAPDPMMAPTPMMAPAPMMAPDPMMASAPVMAPDPMMGNMESPDEKLQRLERENQEIFCALDPNQVANSLEEIRARLLNLQTALESNNNAGGQAMNRGMGFMGGDPTPFGQNNSNFGNPNIDDMRRSLMSGQQMFAGNTGFMDMSRDNYDNPPMDLVSDRGDTSFSEHTSKESDRKLFIGGLHSMTDTRTLRDYFSRYGELVDAVVIEDKKVKRSRGFGFVTYDKSYMAEDAFRSGPHTIDGKVVDVTFAMPKSSDDRDASPRPSNRRGSPDRGRGGGGGNRVPKIFVGGLSNDITTKTLKEYFSRYGRIVDCISMVDANSRPRGFGFVEFQDWDSSTKVLNDAPHRIKGTDVTVDRPKPRDDANSSSRGSGRGGGRDGGGDSGRGSGRGRGNDSGRGSGRDGGNERSGGGGGGSDDNDPYKMFVGGLKSTTTERSLENYFSRFGKIKDVKIIRYSSGNSKCYGFVYFREAYMVQDAMDKGPHEIDGHRIDTGFPTKRKGDQEPSKDRQRSRRRSRDSSVESISAPEVTFKIFVGNLSEDTNEEILYDYFCKYGEIKEANVKISNKNRKNRFGFVTFVDDSSVQEALQDGPHEIDGSDVIVEASHSKSQDKRDGGRHQRDRSPESPERAQRRKAARRSHLD